MALAGDASRLELRACRGDVRIEARAGGGNQVYRDVGIRVLRLQRCDIGGDTVDQLLVRRGVVGAARVGGVIAVACSRWPGVEVLRAGKRLADDARADELAILLDQLAVRLVLEENLREAGDEVGIDEAEDEGRDDGVKNSGDKVATHGGIP